MTTMTEGTSHEALIEAQIAIENQLLAVAELKALETAEENVAKDRIEQVPTIRRLIQTSLLAAADAVTEHMTEVRRQTDRAEAYALVEPLGAELIALVGLTTAIRRTMAGSTMTAAVVEAGRQLEAEARGKSLRDYDPELHKRMVRRRRTMTPAQKRKAIQKIAAGQGWEWEPWGARKHAMAGGVALTAAFATGLVEVVVERDLTTGKVLTLLKLTDTALAAMSSTNLLATVQATLIPMVCQPKPWSTDPKCPGPYYSDRLTGTVDLIRSPTSICRETLHTWGRVAGVANSLSQVPTKVDKVVLEAVQLAAKHSWSLPKFPEPPAEPLSAPSGFDTWADDAKAEWRRTAAERRDSIAQATVARAVLEGDVGWLSKLAEYPAIYQPHSADWRGRLYPLGSLHHQREDRVRSIFRFANEKAVGQAGARWLMIHFANCAAGDAHGKLDKGSYAERLEWAGRSLGLAKAVASEWRERPELWSKGIDKPFAFLQAAVEVARLETEGPGMRSGIPIGLDGTNSGLQHLAAMTRSLAEGTLVNLTVSDRPQDVYAVVAEAAAEIMQEIANDSFETNIDGAREAAQRWLDYGITRSTVKRQVMTYGYSAVEFGFTDQIREDIMKPLARKVAAGKLAEHPFDEGEGTAGMIASRVMARAIWIAVQRALPGAASAMNWLRGAASILAKAGHHASWTSPLGAVVTQMTPLESREERIELFLSSSHYTLPTGRSRSRITLRRDPKGVSVKRAMNGICPNFVHTHDAAHLQLVVEEMVRLGSPDLLMIHDQFGTLPADVALMDRVLRDQFVSMYEAQCPMERLREMALELHGVELPPPPPHGSLDLGGIRHGGYFFN